MVESLRNIPIQFWATLCEMAPYLLLGFLGAGLLSVFIRPELIERHLGGRGLTQVVKASAIGVPLPLCSCGVLPVAAGLRRGGAGRGATVAFLISTPQTGVDSILPTLGLLGPTMAIYRPIAALVSGIFGGVLADLFGGHDAQRRADASTATVQCSPDVRRPGAVQSPGTALPGVPSSCCEDHTAASQAPRPGRLRRAVSYGFGTLPKDVGTAMLIGLAIAAFLSALAPPAFFSKWLGGGLVSMLVMMAVGIPIYVCATASVPIAAALILAGASPGAALVFLMTGPATNAATVATVWKTMGWRTAVAYLASVALSALAAGLLLDLVYAQTGAVAGQCLHLEVPGALKSGMAIALLAVLVAGVVRNWRSRVAEANSAHADAADACRGSSRPAAAEPCCASAEVAVPAPAESEAFFVPKCHCGCGSKGDAKK